MPLPETTKNGVYNAVLVTIEERPGATMEMFMKFLRDNSVPGTEIEAVKEPYATKPGYHYHGVILRELKFKVGRWLTAANKTAEFRGMQFNYWPNTRKIAGAGFAAKAVYCKNYLRDPSKDKITGEVHVVGDPERERREAEARSRAHQTEVEFGCWRSGNHYTFRGDLCYCSGGYELAGIHHHDGGYGNTKKIHEQDMLKWNQYYEGHIEDGLDG